MAKFIQLLPIKIDDPDDGTYHIELYALDDEGDVWRYRYMSMTTNAGWRKLAMAKEERENG